MDFKNLTVAITGGSGAFGNAFVRYLLAHDVYAVRVISRNEGNQARMRRELPDERVRFLVGDVRDEDRMAMAFRGADIVCHAAALKRVDKEVYDPIESIKTNVSGSVAVVNAALRAQVWRCLAISSDKACQAQNLYGATKHTMEQLFTYANVYAGAEPPRFASVRYGNVLGSTGSVLVLWGEQMQRGEALTLTDDRMTRFWMTLDQTCDLVAYALGNMQGGEVFIPKMPRSRVTDLAAAFAPGWPRTHTGFRPGGEKLHETLVSEDEARHTYDQGDVYSIEPEYHEWDGNRKPKGTLLPEGFVYRSNTDPLLTVDELQDVLRKAGIKE